MKWWAEDSYEYYEKSNPRPAKDKMLEKQEKSKEQLEVKSGANQHSLKWANAERKKIEIYTDRKVNHPLLKKWCEFREQYEEYLSQEEMCILEEQLPTDFKKIIHKYRKMPRSLKLKHKEMLIDTIRIFEKRTDDIEENIFSKMEVDFISELQEVEEELSKKMNKIHYKP